MSRLKRWGISGLAGVAGFMALSLALSPEPTDFLGVDPDQGGVPWLVLRLAIGWLLAHVCFWWTAPEQGDAAAAGFGGLAGVILLLILLPNVGIDPRKADWIDPAELGVQSAQNGWIEFRDLAWPSSTDGTGDWRGELGGTVLGHGSIPLLALPAKGLSDRLPEPFQYLGLWLLLCFGLQGALGGLLMRCLTQDPRLQMVGTGFFLFCPMFWGAASHPAAAAHWLLLAGLWLYFRAWGNGHPGRLWLGWLALVAVSLAVQGQLAVMVVLLAVTYLARAIWVDRTLGWGKGLFWALTLAGVVAVGGYALGYQDSNTFTGLPAASSPGGSIEDLFLAEQAGGVPPEAEPHHEAGMPSQVALPLPEIGIGVWLLGSWCLLMLLMRPLDRAGFQPWTPLLILGAVLVVLALLPSVSGGAIPLLDLRGKLSPVGWDWLGAADRYLWLVAYAGLFLLIALLTHAHPPRRAVLLLSLALALQACGTTVRRCDGATERSPSPRPSPSGRGCPEGG